MHSMKSKIIAAVSLLLVIALVVGIAYSGMEIKPSKSETEDENTEAEIDVDSDKETVYLWYTDETLTDYLESEAVNYAAGRDDVRVIPMLVSGMEYLESISKASVENDKLPDLYITSNDNLEKAYLAGLADEVEVPSGRELESYFPETAVNACTYNDKVIGYPLYYDCAAFLYNETYLDNWSVTEAQGEVNAAENENATLEDSTADTDETASDSQDSSEKTDQTDADSAETESDASAEDSGDSSEETEEIDPAILSRAAEIREEYFPTSIDKLLSFSDTYDAPQELDTIFKWDVNDIFYNYFFIGDSIDVGGACGDDRDSLDLYNENAIKGLMTYQDLNRFFSISTDDISYDAVLEDFMAGKILFTIATSDAVATLKTAKDNGDMTFDYGFAALPNIMEGSQARSMSVTDAVVVNGYSEHKALANDFASYLCEQDGMELYNRTGKVSALSDVSYGDDTEYLNTFMSEYERSVPMPKMMETSDLWVRLEMLFASVWDGDDANEGLKQLSEQMHLQVSGQEYTETPIVIEEETAEEDDEIIETDTLDEMPEE